MFTHAAFFGGKNLLSLTLLAALLAALAGAEPARPGNVSPQIQWLEPFSRRAVAPTRESHLDVAVLANLPAGDAPLLAQLERNGHPVAVLDFDVLDSQSEAYPRAAARRPDGGWALRFAGVPLWPGRNWVRVKFFSRQGFSGALDAVIARTQPGKDLALPLEAGVERLAGDIRVPADLVIPANRTLTLAAGTVLRFAPGAGLTCHGRLAAQGRAEEPVWLIPDAPGTRWRNLAVTGPGASALLQYVNILDGCGLATEWKDGRTVPRLTGEAAPTAGSDGGALLVASTGTAEPTRLENCRLLDNVAAQPGKTCGMGGALFVERATVALDGCEIAGNRAGADGGAVYAFQEAAVALSNCKITGNAASRDGGGIFVLQNTSCRVAHCVLEHNECKRNGGAVNLNVKARAEIEACALSRNGAGKTGAGLVVLGQAEARLAQCAFANNHAQDSGGGIFCSELAAVHLDGCQFTGNSAGVTGGALLVLNCQPEIERCQIEENTAQVPESAGGVAVRYRPLATGKPYDGPRLSPDALRRRNTIQRNRPKDVVFEGE